MALYKSAQSMADMLEVEIPAEEMKDKVVIYDQKPTKEEVLEVHAPEGEPHAEEGCVFVLPLIPGATNLEPIEVKMDEVEEEHPAKKEDKDKDEAADVSVSDPWKYELNGFIHWLQDKMSNFPRHSGNDLLGLERAIAYAKKLISEATSAVRQDWKGEIDINQASDALDKLYDGLHRLEDRRDMIQESKYKRKKKADENPEMVKEAQKVPRVGGTIVTVPLLISSIARALINGTISSGKDIEDLYKRAIKIHNLDINQQTELVQLLNDMNFPMRRDFLYGAEDDTSDQEKGSLLPNYQA